MAAIALAAMVALTPSVCRRLRGIRRFEYCGAPLAEDAYVALASRSGWRARSVALADGAVVRGLERRRSGEQAPVILFFAGNSGTLLSDSQRFLDLLIEDRPWGAFVWAYRGFDGSQGVPSPAALNDDGWELYTRLVTDEHLNRDRVHVIGFSLGTSVAAVVAARAGRDGPASLVLLAPLTEIDVAETGQRFRADRYELLSDLDTIAGPVLVIQGAKDEMLPVQGGRLVAARLGQRARFVEIPELLHAGVLEAPTSLAAIRSFVAENAR